MSSFNEEIEGTLSLTAFAFSVNSGVANAARATAATGSRYTAFVQLQRFDLRFIIILILFVSKLWLKPLAKA